MNAIFQQLQAEILNKINYFTSALLISKLNGKFERRTETKTEEVEQKSGLPSNGI